MNRRFRAADSAVTIGLCATATISLIVLLCAGCTKHAGNSGEDRRLVERWLKQGCTIERDSLRKEIGSRGAELEPYFIEALLDLPDVAPGHDTAGAWLYTQCRRAYSRIGPTRLPPEAAKVFRRIEQSPRTFQAMRVPPSHQRIERLLTGLGIGGGPSAEKVLNHFRTHGAPAIRAIAERAMKLLKNDQRRSPR
jgi:hypothetical protein